MKELLEFSNKEFDGLEFCTKVYSLFEEIRSKPEGITSLRMRVSSLEKRLLEELMPICKYIQINYRAGRYLSVCWVNGAQQFDAIVKESGWYIDQGFYPKSSYLEVTCAVHPNDYLARERLEKEGYYYGYAGLSRNKDKSIESLPSNNLGLSFINSDSEIISKIIRKKCSINYPENTTLIIQATLSTVYGAGDWQKLVGILKHEIKLCPFKSIFICDSEHVYSDYIL